MCTPQYRKHKHKLNAVEMGYRAVELGAYAAPELTADIIKVVGFSVSNKEHNA
jgi:hypothetical protein